MLASPVGLRAAFLLVAAVVAFTIALWIIRRLRDSLNEEYGAADDGPASLEALPLHLYNTVIQQLKQQKHELQVQNQAEQRRARSSEVFSQAVLTNLSSGVLVFGNNGLVKHANPAAREILGFGSLSGMNAEDVFRGATVCATDARAVYPDGVERFPVPLAEEVLAILREGCQRRQIEADYRTPDGTNRRIAVTISAVPAADGTLAGAACLIGDRSELEGIRRQQELQGEISAEMALDLRTSLATIAGYAQQLAGNRDPEKAEQLAADIASEAARLDRHIGGFLAEKHSAASSVSRAAGVV
jgi:PAS domain-containing protein